MIWRRDGFDYLHESGKWKIEAKQGVILYQKNGKEMQRVKMFSDIDQAKLWVHKQAKGNKK